MNKKVLIVVIAALVGAGLAGYFLWGKKSGKSAEDATESILESATQGILPSLETNPLENKPDLNPADKANPFKNIKTNPFE